MILEPTSDRESDPAGDRLPRPDGATNAEAGLALGYAMAPRHRRGGQDQPRGPLSDGVANVGATGPESILGARSARSRAGIELTTVGFGMGNYNDVLMEQLADKGNGRYAYVDTLDEAQRVFVENLTGTLQTIARMPGAGGVRPRRVTRYRLLGYENRDIADEEFRDDTVDAGEIGAGHQVTAVYEIRLAPGVSSGKAATLRLRYRSAETKEFVETEQDLRGRRTLPVLGRGAPRPAPRRARGRVRRDPEEIALGEGRRPRRARRAGFARSSATIPPTKKSRSSRIWRKGPHAFSRRARTRPIPSRSPPAPGLV